MLRYAALAPRHFVSPQHHHERCLRALCPRLPGRSLAAPLRAGPRVPEGRVPRGVDSMVPRGIGAQGGCGEGRRGGAGVCGNVSSASGAARMPLVVSSRARWVVLHRRHAYIARLLAQSLFRDKRAPCATPERLAGRWLSRTESSVVQITTRSSDNRCRRCAARPGAWTRKRLTFRST